MAIDDSSLRAPIQMDSILVSCFEETIKVQVQVQEETKEENEIILDAKEEEAK